MARGMPGSTNWEDPDYYDPENAMPLSAGGRASTSLRSPDFQLPKPTPIVADAATSAKAVPPPQQVGNVSDLAPKTAYPSDYVPPTVMARQFAIDQDRRTHEDAQSQHRVAQDINHADPFQSPDGRWRKRAADPTTGAITEFDAPYRVDHQTGAKLVRTRGGEVNIGVDEPTAARAQMLADRRELSLQEQSDDLASAERRAQIHPIREELKAFGDTPKDFEKRIDVLKAGLGVKPDPAVAARLEREQHGYQEWRIKNQKYGQLKDEHDRLQGENDAAAQASLERRRKSLDLAFNAEYIRRTGTILPTALIDTPTEPQSVGASEINNQATELAASQGMTQTAATRMVLQQAAQAGVSKVGPFPIEQAIALSSKVDENARLNIAKLQTLDPQRRRKIIFDQMNAAQAAWDNQSAPAQGDTAGNLANTAKQGLVEGFYRGVEGIVNAAVNLGQKIGWQPEALKTYGESVQGLRQGVKDAAPVNSEFGSSLGGQIARGFAELPGQLAPFAVPGGAVIGTIATLGASYQEQYDDAIAAGATPAKAHEAGMNAAPAGFFDALMDHFIIGKIMKPLKGKLSLRKLGGVIVQGLAGGGATEGLQTAWQNFEAKYLSGFDPDRTIDQGVIDSIIVGGIVDSTAATAGAGYNSMRAGRAATARTQGFQAAFQAAQDAQAQASTAALAGDPAAIAKAQDAGLAADNEMHALTREAIAAEVDEADLKNFARIVAPDIDPVAGQASLEQNPLANFATVEIGRAMRSAYITPEQETALVRLQATEGARSVAVDQLVGLRAVNDLQRVLTGGVIDANKAQALDSLGLVEMGTDANGQPSLMVTDDALTLFPATTQQAIKSNPGQFRFTQTPGKPGDGLALNARNGMQRVAEALGATAEQVSPAGKIPSEPEITQTPGKPGDGLALNARNGMQRVAEALGATAEQVSPAGKIPSEPEIAPPATSVGTQENTTFATGPQLDQELDPEVAAAVERAQAEAEAANPTEVPQVPRGTSVEQQPAKKGGDDLSRNTNSRTEELPGPSEGAANVQPVAAPEPALDANEAAGEVRRAFIKNRALFQALGVNAPEVSNDEENMLHVQNGRFVMNPAEIARESAAHAARGVSPKAWIKNAVEEELLHLIQFRAEGSNFGKTYEDIWNDPNLDPQLRAQAKAAYDGLDTIMRSDAEKGAEVVRMVLQARWKGTITERIYKAIQHFVDYLTGLNLAEQSPLLRGAVERAEAVLADVKQQASEEEQWADYVKERDERIAREESETTSAETQATPSSALSTAEPVPTADISGEETLTKTKTRSTPKVDVDTLADGIMESVRKALKITSDSQRKATLDRVFLEADRIAEANALNRTDLMFRVERFVELSGGWDGLLAIDKYLPPSVWRSDYLGRSSAHTQEALEPSQTNEAPEGSRNTLAGDRGNPPASLQAARSPQPTAPALMPMTPSGNPDAIDITHRRKNWWKPAMLAQIATQSAADVLERQKNPVAKLLGRALHKMSDVRAEIEAQISLPFEKVLSGVSHPKIKAKAKADFERYWREHFRNGRAAADALLPNMPTVSENLIKAWQDVAESTGKQSVAQKVMLYDPNLHGKNRGGYRLMRTLGKDFFPRMLNDDVQRAIDDPDKHAALKKKLVADLVSAGWQQDEAENWFEAGGKSIVSRNDFMASIEAARTAKLPESFYSYRFDDVVPRYVEGYSRRMSQIIAFGQKLKLNPNSRDLFDVAEKESRNDETRAYVDAIRRQVYGIGENTYGKRLMQNIRALATGTLLANPLTTVPRNMISGGLATAEMFGTLRSMKTLGQMIAGNVPKMTATQLGTIKANFIEGLDHQDPDIDVSKAIRKFTNFTLKYSGYNASEAFVRWHATATAMQYLTDVNNAAPGSALAREGAAFIKRLGLDPAAVRAENGDFKAGKATRTFIRQAVKEAQFGYDVSQVPVWANGPTGRLLYQFGRWGTQRTRTLWKHVFEPALLGELVERNGQRHLERNLKPLARIIAPLAFGTARVGTTAVVTGEIFAMLAHVLFDRDRDDTEWSEIAEDLSEDQKRGIAELFGRLGNDLMLGGMLGILTQPVDMAKSWMSGSRFKNPIEPPAFAIPRAAMELSRSWLERGTPKTLTDATEGHGRDLWRAVRSVQPGVGAIGDAGGRLAAAVTDHIYLFDQSEARQRVANLRKAARRFAAEQGLEGGGKFDGRYAKRPESVTYDRIQNALLTGDAESAHKIIDEFVDRQPVEKRDKALSSIGSSMRARHPLKVGAHTGESVKTSFDEWASKHLPTDKYAEFKKVQQTYEDTAREVGVMK